MLQVPRAKTFDCIKCLPAGNLSRVEPAPQFVRMHRTANPAQAQPIEQLLYWPSSEFFSSSSTSFFRRPFRSHAFSNNVSSVPAFLPINS